MEKPRKRIWLLIGTVMVLVLALGITAAFAQEGDDAVTPDVTPEDESSSPLPFFGRFGEGVHGFRGTPRFGDGLEGITPRGQLLADALGIELDDLVEAQESAHAAWLAEMVVNGYMEQEEADQILVYQALKDNIDRHAIMASVLGLSETELENAREEGKNLSTLLEEHGLTVEEFVVALETAYQDAVQDLVPEVLTQEQADQILESGEGMQGLGGARPRFGGGMHGRSGARPGFGGGMQGHSGARPGLGTARPGIPGASGFNSFGYPGNNSASGEADI